VIRMRREALLSWKGDVLIPTFPHTTPQDGCWLLVRPIHPLISQVRKEAKERNLNRRW
jgi:hypothetical protein